MMSLYSDYLKLTPMASFTAIYLSNQIFGEVDPYFAKEYDSDLLESWSVIDYKDKLHVVAYNKSSIRPLLTHGWSEMKDVFGFETNQEIDFVYYGKSVFGLMCSKTLDCFCQVPMYHSRFVKIGYTMEFYINVTLDNIVKPFLNVFGSFEDYLRSCNFEFFIVCCDNGTMHSFDIALTEIPFRTTTIGIGWDDFCTRGEFFVGDLLCFKFTLFNPTNVAFVFKIS
ncbi:unnamed protein product [Trifolium pratense]|uniref:Uncharacterized protein n=1 Tax=Trifolium pratense TaxID=57577 RepID=A0ACB0KJQ4_TRIPR|nr:unnamed protein product [Trifolium pratense]